MGLYFGQEGPVIESRTAQPLVWLSRSSLVVKIWNNLWNRSIWVRKLFWYICLAMGLVQLWRIQHHTFAQVIWGLPLLLGRSQVFKALPFAVALAILVRSCHSRELLAGPGLALRPDCNLSPASVEVTPRLIGRLLLAALSAWLNINFLFATSRFVALCLLVTPNHARTRLKVFIGVADVLLLNLAGHPALHSSIHDLRYLLDRGRLLLWVVARVTEDVLHFGFDFVSYFLLNLIVDFHSLLLTV